MFYNFFMVHIKNKTEEIFCEPFKSDIYGYIPNNQIKFRKIYTEKDFKTKEEYNKYLDKKGVTSIDTRYDACGHTYYNSVGTLLFDFLDMQFSSPTAIGKLLFKYGITSFFSAFGCENEFLEYMNFEEKNSLSWEEIENLYRLRSLYLLDEFKETQSDFKKIIDFVFNLDEKDIFKGLTPSQRYFIFLNTDKSSTTKNIFNYTDNIKVLFDIDFNENSKLKLNSKKDYSIEELVHLIKKKDTKNHNYKAACHFYTFENLSSACYFTILYFIENNIPIKKCKNCGKYFVPENRASSVYCNRKFEGKKTCRDIGAINTYNEKLKKDEVNSLYRKTLSAKKMLANRNPDIPMYLERYEEWKTTANRFKQDIKNGLKTNEEFKEWIEKTK